MRQNVRGAAARGNRRDGRREQSGECGCLRLRGSAKRRGSFQCRDFTQKGCRYIPHLLAFQVNQELKITNEDQTVHNVHPQPKRNREWNKSQPPGAPPIRESYEQAEFIPVKCNVHPWMHGTFAVMPNSHYAVTGPGGSFSLPNLPPGKYTITAWHESYGEQSQQVTITGSETHTLNFVFKLKPN